MRLLLTALLALATAPALAQLAPAPADELLDPEKAFRISARALDERNLEVEFKIAPGYYMYRDRFSFATESGKPLADVDMPRGKLKEDQFFGKSETFRDLVRIRVPLSPEDAAKGRVNLKVISQGCADSGVCYVPLEQIVKVALPGASTAIAEDALAAFSGLGAKASRGVDALRAGAARLSWAAFAASLAAGLALGWASAGAPLRWRGAVRALRLQGFSAWAWSVALAAAGGTFAWLGSTIAGRAENPWVAAPLAAAYVAAAALWFRWSLRGTTHSSGMLPNVLLFAAVLLFSAHRGDIALGAAAMLGAGLAAGLLPKGRPGAEQELALQCVALAMFGAAVWVAQPLLPDGLRMLAWSALLFVAAGLLRAIDPLPERAPPALRVAKIAGVIFLVWAIAVLIGAASGARDPLQPFAAWRAAPAVGITGTGR